MIDLSRPYVQQKISYFFLSKSRGKLIAFYKEQNSRKLQVNKHAIHKKLTKTA